jgi:hypothetical protein
LNVTDLLNSDLLSGVVRSRAGGVCVRHFIGLGGEGFVIYFIALFNFNFVIGFIKIYKSITITFSIIIERTRNESENREMSYNKNGVNKKWWSLRHLPSFLFFYSRASGLGPEFYLRFFRVSV